MDYILRERAKLFGKYISAALKGEIVTRGYSQGEVADGIQRQKANLSRWLNGKPTIPIEVAHEVCDFIGVDLQDLVANAEQRIIRELGSWPPVEVDPLLLSDEEKVQLVLKKIAADDQTLAASTDPYKKYEKEGGDGR
jgi:transcriptional regulator with XRE-family HTH domain